METPEKEAIVNAEGGPGSARGGRRWRGPVIGAVVLSLFCAGLPYGFLVWFFSHDPEECRRIDRSIPPWFIDFIKGLGWFPGEVESFADVNELPCCSYPLDEFWEGHSHLPPEYWRLNNWGLWHAFLQTFLEWLMVTLPLTFFLRKLLVAVVRRRWQ